MKKIFLLLLTLSFICTQSNIFISEYGETQSATDRYIEIYNGSDTTLDLAFYYLKITRNNDNEYLIPLNDNSNDSNNNGFLVSGNVLIVI